MFDSWHSTSGSNFCQSSFSIKRMKFLYKGQLSSLLTAEDFCFFCDLYLQFIAPINLWNKSIDLRLFLKCKEGPFLRPLRSKDNRCWILRLRPRNFAIVPENLVSHLRKVRYSHLFNKRGGWNKRGGGAKVAKSLNVQVGINVEGGIFWKKTST